MNSFVYELAITPEVQRLRDIRLSNINSLFLSGISNISRFEHSLGVAYLANLISKKLDLEKIDRYNLICASLLHDVATPPFGHTIENIFKRKDESYNHEKIIRMILKGHSDPDYNIYGRYTQIDGKELKVHKVIKKKKISGVGLNSDFIGDMIIGKYGLGDFINKDLDLDNIDNVLRMAYHLGIKFECDLPFNILNGYRYAKDKIYYDKKNLDFIHKWIKIRKNLYSELMVNPYDFSLKTMLSEATSVAIDNGEIEGKKDWSLTDSQLLMRLAKKGSTSAGIINRLIYGELYCVEGMYWIDDIEVINIIKNYESLKKIENLLSNKLNDTFILYTIYDHNKSTRQIEFDTLNENGIINGKDIENIVVGEPVNKMLIGVVSELSFNKSFKREYEIKREMEEILGDVTLKTQNFRSLNKDIHPEQTRLNI